MAGRPKKEPHTLPDKPRPIRPAKFVAEHQAEILHRVSEGETVTKVAKELGFSLAQVWDLRQKDPKFDKMYIKALQSLTDAWLDRVADEARDCEDVQKGRLIVDTLKWIASKRKPNEYGDQIKITHDVDDGLAEIGADALTKLGEQLLRATKGG